MAELTPEQEAKRLWIDCYPNDLPNDLNGNWAKHYARKIAKQSNQLGIMM